MAWMPVFEYNALKPTSPGVAVRCRDQILPRLSTSSQMKQALQLQAAAACREIGASDPTPAEQMTSEDMAYFENQVFDAETSAVRRLAGYVSDSGHTALRDNNANASLTTCLTPFAVTGSPRVQAPSSKLTFAECTCATSARVTLGISFDASRAIRLSQCALNVSWNCTVIADNRIASLET